MNIKHLGTLRFKSSRNYDYQVVVGIDIPIQTRLLKRKFKVREWAEAYGNKFVKRWYELH